MSNAYDPEMEEVIEDMEAGYGEEAVDEQTVTGPGLNRGERIRVRKSNPLDKLKSTLNQKIKKDDVTFAIPERENVSLIFHTEMDLDLLTAYQRKATMKLKGGGTRFHEMNFAAMLLMHLSAGISFDGEQVFEEDGTPITLRSSSLADDLGVLSTQRVSILRALYGYDGHILITMRDLMTACGFGDDITVEAEDDDFPNT